MDKCFATWINCKLLKTLSISISLSRVAASYIFGQLSFDIMFSLLALYTLLVLDSSLSSSGNKRGRHFIFYMDVDMTCNWSWQFLCVLLLWIFDMLIMITFLCICGYVTCYWTHECILTIFRQVIFVDICVLIHLKLVEVSW